MQDALQLRFSLVGGMFEFITCSYQSINDWGVLLVRLIVRGVIDLTNNADLYCTALDMITALIHSTLVIDREVGGIEAVFADPGSGAFFDPWIRDGYKVRFRVRDEQPGSYLRELRYNFLGYYT